MAEYIDREKLLKRFNIDDMMNVNGTLISLRDAREIISSFPAVSVQQWISVKDGMPENEKQVILLRRNGKVSRAEVRKIGETVRFRLYSEEDDYSPVTHWAAFPAMPLPEPPKGDADNG